MSSCAGWRGVLALLLALAPLPAWSADRSPMPPPASLSAQTAPSHADKTVGGTTSPHPTASSPNTASETAQSTMAADQQQAIDIIEGGDVRAYTRQDGTKITEYARHGRVYMIKVKPPGNLPAYYLYDERGNGQFSRRLPGSYQHRTPPQWVLKEF